MEVKREAIKELRRSRSWSQQHLADACDVNLRTIQRVETLGVAAPETVLALASVLEVEQSQIILAPRADLPRLMPKTDRGIAILSIFTTLIGVVIGFLLTFLFN
ncbi:MAG: transcriptional regulator [Alphaproteobacteria bacterium]|nr:MAG: transcriptional regulator [Alphaproteobacteria bacterium]